MPIPSVSSSSSIQGPLPFEPIQVEHFEKILLALYEMTETEDKNELSYLSFAVQAQQAYREQLAHKIEEEQARFNKIVAANGLLAKISNLVQPLFLAAEGIVSLAGGTSSIPHSTVAIALGSVLALDALADLVFDMNAKKLVAACLERLSNESQEDWLARITTVCVGTSLAVGASLPSDIVAKLAQGLSTSFLSASEGGLSLVSSRQKASLKETNYFWEQSGRTTHALLSSFRRQQECQHDQLSIMTQLRNSTSAAIEDIT